MSVLSENQIRTLKSAIDRIVPADDYPSASQSGCLEFLVRLIELEGLSEIYQNGLDALEIESQKRGNCFDALTPVEQDQLFSELDRSRQRSGWKVAPSKFIALLARQTIEGYYSDPGNGGNRDQIAWKMVGFEVRG